MNVFDTDDNGDVDVVKDEDVDHAEDRNDEGSKGDRAQVEAEGAVEGGGQALKIVSC